MHLGENQSKSARHERNRVVQVASHLFLLLTEKESEVNPLSCFLNILKFLSCSCCQGKLVTQNHNDSALQGFV